MRHGNISPSIAEGLKILQQRIGDAGIPSSKLDESINVATWNIREFGRKRNGAFRSEHAIHYLAEILGQFDLIAVVELRDDLGDLGRVMQILGPYWRVLFSDYNADPQGNRERVAFLYDKRAVVPTGLAAEADPPRTMNVQTGEYVPAITWWRSPYMASFRAGSFDFVQMAVHVRWSSSEQSRAGELSLLADWIERRVLDKGNEEQDFLVTGDFNIPANDGPLFHAITSHGLEIPAGLRNNQFGTNLAKNKRYDQILHYPKYTSTANSIGGVLDFFRDDFESLFPRSEFPKMTQNEFTYQMSDHLPLWLQLRTDVESERLDQVLASRRKPVVRARR
jgi:endonuclease/exonuclease/phosphatase family metal-dependent hydrolase